MTRLLFYITNNYGIQRNVCMILQDLDLIDFEFCTWERRGVKRNVNAIDLSHIG